MPITLPTQKMAKHIGVSADFLRKNKGVLFVEGKHYTRPIGLKRDMWNVKAMEDWALGKEALSDTAKKVLDNIL